jgi:hypothetical protein
MRVEIRLLDLHGLGLHAAIDAFRCAYNEALASIWPAPIKVVHGYGSTGQGGIIIWKLRDILQEHRRLGLLAFECGEDIDRKYTSLGYTIVYPHSL